MKKTKLVTIRLTEDEYKMLKKLKEFDFNLSYSVRELIRKKYKEYESEK